MLEKNTWHSVSDNKNYDDKENIVTLLYGILGNDYSRKDIMFWAKNVTEDSMDDPNLIVILPNEMERKFVVDNLLKLKKLGLDN